MISAKLYIKEIEYQISSLERIVKEAEFDYKLNKDKQESNIEYLTQAFILCETFKAILDGFKSDIIAEPTYDTAVDVYRLFYRNLRLYLYFLKNPYSTIEDNYKKNYLEGLIPYHKLDYGAKNRIKDLEAEYPLDKAYHKEILEFYHSLDKFRF